MSPDDLPDAFAMPLSVSSVETTVKPLARNPSAKSSSFVPNRGATWLIGADCTALSSANSGRPPGAPAGAFNTFVLLTSSLTIVLAHAASERRDLKKCFNYIWYTIFGGLVFALVKLYEYTSKIFPEWYHTPATHEPITILSNVFWSFYFTATGLHALHVLGGMVIMGMISMDVLKGRNLQRVELIGLYWHFVDIVWIFLFPLLYIANF